MQKFARHPAQFALLILLTCALMLVACAPVAPGAASATGEAPSATETQSLTVFAAASLAQAFTEIGEAFTAAQPGTEILFNFAGSNQLATQISEGAPADVFASANRAQMDVTIEAGRILSGTARTFVSNQLVIIAPSDNPAGLTTIADLATPGTLVVLAAAQVPAGQYALEFLDKAAADPALGEAFKAGVLANLVSYEENVRAVVTKVTLGEADAGIVYTSDTAGALDSITQIAIPDALNTLASYPIAPLADSRNRAGAQAFVDFVQSSAGQQILAEYGFIPAAP